MQVRAPGLWVPPLWAGASGDHPWGLQLVGPLSPSPKTGGGGLLCSGHQRAVLWPPPTQVLGVLGPLGLRRSWGHVLPGFCCGWARPEVLFF